MTTATAQSSSTALNAVKVNVRLCGSVPRQEMESLSLSQCFPHILQSRTLNTNSYLAAKKAAITTTSKQYPSEYDKSCLARQICSQLSSSQLQQHALTPQRHAPDFAPPTWAVPASGEARLEPVCDSLFRQLPVNLTERPFYRVGRSPQSDVQLLHATSSRKHAMLFHHSNGSCYLVDCGSAHGTYVNGIRVSSPPNGGVVVPHKVKRGSLIRFGGPGAPQFMLKSFAFDLKDMKDTPSVNPTLTPTSRMGAVVVHNTRFNSLGKTAKDSLFVSLSSKRSFDSMDTVDSDFEFKRMRCSSPPLSPEHQQARLVSPDMGLPSKRRRVSFSSEPPKAFCPNLISPDLSSDENELL